MFKLPAYKSPARASKFQQATILSRAQQAQPLVASHSAIFVLGDSASYVICQSSCNSKDPVPAHTNRKKKLGLDKIPGIHSAITIILIK